MKSLRRWYDASLSDVIVKSQVEELRKETRQGIAKIDKSGLAGMLNVPLSKIERMEK